jgi:hypothetical protein
VTLIEILLPLRDGAGKPQPKEAFAELRHLLVERFGGLTAFTRSPAEGLWAEGGARVERDDIVVLEVMAEEIDRAWWQSVRKRLEARFHQETVVIRASAIEIL